MAVAVTHTTQHPSGSDSGDGKISKNAWNEGHLITGLPLSKYNGTAAPTVNDDTGDGYEVGSIWVDTTADAAYICADASSGAAVWLPFDAGGGALVGERSLWDTPASYPLSTDGSEMEYADRTAFLVDFSRRNVADAHLAFPPGSHVEVRFDAEGDAIYLPLDDPSAANFWALMEWSSGRHLDSMVGISILNTSGTGIGFALYQGTFYNINVTGWAYASFGNGVTNSTADDAVKSGKRILFGLEQISTTQYRGAMSINGTSLETRPTANTPSSFTPAYYGFHRMYSGGSNTEAIHRVHRLWTAPTFP